MRNRRKKGFARAANEGERVGARCVLSAVPTARGGVAGMFLIGRAGRPCLGGRPVRCGCASARASLAPGKWEPVLAGRKLSVGRGNGRGAGRPGSCDGTAAALLTAP